MRVLALETSSRQASAALLEQGAAAAAANLDPEQQPARVLAPKIAELLKQVGWRAADLELIAVSQGPGSFTGLRIGVTMAKTLAYATGAEVFGVDTLEVVAAQAWRELPPENAGRGVHAVVNAFRGQVFAAEFRLSPDNIVTRCGETQVAAVDAWLASLTEGAVVAGPMVEMLKDRLPATVVMAGDAAHHPRAETVGQLALERYQSGQRCDLWQLAPAYYRRSAAEEKLDAQGDAESESHK